MAAKKVERQPKRSKAGKPAETKKVTETADSRKEKKHPQNNKTKAEQTNLPDSYFETHIVLLPVEPHKVHAYWEVAREDLDRAKRQLGKKYKRSQPALRFYDITDASCDGFNPSDSFDIGIQLEAKNRYVALDHADKTYFVELGFKTRDGKFLPVACSNAAETSPASPASETDERYMLVGEDFDLVEMVPKPVIEESPPAAPTEPLTLQEEVEGIETEEKPVSELQSPLVTEEEFPGVEVGKELFPERCSRSESIEIQKADQIPRTGEITAESGQNGSLRKIPEETEQHDETRIVQPGSSEAILQKRLAEFYEFRRGHMPPSRQEIPSTEDIPAPEFGKENDIDLTEMSEKKFIRGVSSC